MNEMIYKLAVEVGIIKEEKGYFWIQSVDTLEQFAEAIIKDCLEACDSANNIRHFVPPSQSQVVLSCKEAINRKFRS